MGSVLCLGTGTGPRVRSHGCRTAQPVGLPAFSSLPCTASEPGAPLGKGQQKGDVLVVFGDEYFPGGSLLMEEAW